MNQENVEFLLRGMTDSARLLFKDRRADDEIAEVALTGENLEGRKGQHVGRGIFTAELPVQALHLSARNERNVEPERRFSVTRRKTGLPPKRRRR